MCVLILSGFAGDFKRGMCVSCQNRCFMGAEGADLLILFLLGAGKTQLLSRFRSEFP